VRGRRIKLRYAHQGGRNPPRIIIHGNQTVHVPEAYTRYLANVFRREFDLFASPVAVEYRTDANPYARSKGRPQRATASEKRAAAKAPRRKATAGKRPGGRGGR
jgi:GTP-binding protein